MIEYTCLRLDDMLFQIKRNKILILCLIALTLDPLFCYILVVNDGKKCLRLDRTLGTIVIVVRSIIDFFHILHVVFQFRATRSINPVDILAILPLPQVLLFAIIPKMNNLRVLKAAKSLNLVFIFQYVLRFLHICSLLKKELKTTGILAKSTSANLFFLMLASHVLGAFWFLFSVERKATCWLEACSHVGVHCSLYCDNTYRASTILKNYCATNSTNFDFGIYGDAFSSAVVDSVDIVQRISYCFWWGLQNLSSLGQGLKTSTYVWEIYFAILVSISGLLSFAFLIGNVQAYLLSEVARAEEGRLRAEKMKSLRQDLESWRFFLTMPQNLREKILETMERKLQENISIDGYNLFNHLPTDLMKDATRHLGMNLLKRVPLFDHWRDTELLVEICDRLKPELYVEESYLSEAQEIVDSIIFIARGRVSRTSDGGSSQLSMMAGDYFGDEVLSWAIFSSRSSSDFPKSVATVKSVSKVLVFILKAVDIKRAASQYLQVHDIHNSRHIWRYYSREWRTWAACFIQAAWRSHCRKKLNKALREEVNTSMQVAVANASSSLSQGATIYSSRFAANVPRPVRIIGKHRAIMSQGNPPKLIKKPLGLV